VHPGKNKGVNERPGKATGAFCLDLTMPGLQEEKRHGECHRPAKAVSGRNIRDTGNRTAKAFP
jgi:hypothetical protein